MCSVKVPLQVPTFVGKAIKKIKSTKGTREDDIPIDLLKKLGKNELTKLTQVSTEVIKKKNSHRIFLT